MPDRCPGLGPLGGISTALHSAFGRPIFVLACDMPFVSSEVARYLLEKCRVPLDDGVSTDLPEAGLARAHVPIHHGQLQPLCAVYETACISVVDRALEEGSLSVMELMGKLELIEIEIDREDLEADPDLFKSVNSPADVALARERLDP